MLLQALAPAKPVVVSRTGAIADGLRALRRRQLRLVEPEAIRRARARARGVSGHGCMRLGADARATVERSLSWARYVAFIVSLL